MALFKARPLRLALEEAEVAARARPPLVILRQARPGVVQDAEDVFLADTVVLEGVHGLDLRLVRDVAVAVLVGADGDVGQNAAAGELRLEPVLERLQLQHGRTPAHPGRRQIVVVDLQVVAERAVRVQPRDRLAQERFQSRQILVSLGQLLARVAEIVVHVRDTVAHVDREGGTVLAARNAEDVDRRLTCVNLSRHGCLVILPAPCARARRRARLGAHRPRAR